MNNRNKSDAPCTFTIPGIVRVSALPDRRMREAKALALRIAAQPRAYLAVVRLLNIDGIEDLRYGENSVARHLATTIEDCEVSNV